jgi:potassium-transporting ATPase potassium-binding subunit
MANNGQTMAGLSVNNLFYNLTTVIAMLIGRYGLATLALALAGSFAAQRRVLTTAGTLPADTPAFGALVFGTILLGGHRASSPLLGSVPSWSSSGTNHRVLLS